MLTALLLAGLEAGAQTAPRPNLVLITLDTLRADRLGCYGYQAAETPALDRLAREGIRCEHAFAVAPLTRPAHATILTGRLPFSHGLRDNISPALPATIPTLAELLHNQGYASAGLVASFLLNRSSGLGRGFDLFSDAFDPDQRDRQLVSSFQRRGGEVMDQALAWLRQSAEPFFLWVHLYDPHAPYDPPEPFASRHAGRPYDGEIAYADLQVGRLLAALERSGRLDRSLVAAIGDHGEGLGDHGEHEHSFFIYGSTLRVPLILRLPGIVPAGATLREPVSQIDLLPTLLDLLGLAAPPLPGRSLRPRWGADPPARPAEIYSESLYAYLHFGWASLRSLIEGRLKLIEAPQIELYDLAADPGETRNLAAERAQDVERLRQRLEVLAGASPAARPAPAVDSETLRALGALGYVSGSSSEPAAGPRRDPKQGLAEFQGFHDRLQSAIADYSSGRQAEALSAFEALANHSIQSFEAHYYLGKLKADSGAHRAAVSEFERARELLPSFAPVTFDLARSLLALGQGEQASRVIDQALQADPGSSELLLFRGFIRQRLRRFDAAAADYRELLRLDPSSGEAHLRLSECLLAQSQPAAAREHLLRAVDSIPDSTAAWNNLGVVEHQLGNLEQARAAFDRAAGLDPGNARTRFNRARVLETLGEREAAARDYREALRLDPRLADARARLAALEGKIRLRQIVVASRSEAEKLRALLLEGADFAALARQHSLDPTRARDGELGSVARGELLPELEAAAFALAPGELSRPIQSRRGFHLLQRLP
jgi:arylsulfatase A-like enzyme/parvulin-like peptidyl-prolyl isomerase